MVCSQVYSQHPVSSNVHHWVPSNAEVHCREPETSEANGFGNTTPDGHFLSSKGYACGYASITSPLKSSWIQRLIPSHTTRVEQPQPSDKLNREDHHIDGLQTNWKENADILGNQCVYENSRRSKQDFFSSHQTYLGTNTPECVQNGVNIRPFEASNALPPEIQVSPKPLPIVKSLLPGHSEKVTEYQTSTETKMPDILSRCTGLANPMKQTVHYSADEKSRVSCSSIEGLYSHSVVCAVGDLPVLKSLQMVKRCIQPFSEFSFNSIGAVARSNMDPTYDVKDRPSGPTIRTYMNSTQTEDPLVTLRTESRYHDLHQGWASSAARCQSVENRPLDGYSMLYGEEAIETDQRLPLGASMDRLPCLKTISRRNCCNPKEHHSYVHDGSEALYAREGSFDVGWWPIPNTGKDEPRQISNLVPSHGGANVAKEKVDTSSSHHMIEQDLGSLHGSREEQGGTSRSFSFHFENRLASELDNPKVVTKEGHWPFGPSKLTNEDLVQSRWSEDNRARGLAEATRPGLPRDNSSIFQETDVCDAGTAHIGRSQSSPFFGTENLNGSASRIGGVFIGEMNTQALSGSSVDQAGQTLQGGCPLSRLESDLIIEGVEGKELMLSFPPRTLSVKNWKAFRPSIQSSTRTCSPEGAQLNYADGNCVSENNGKVFEPPIRSSTYTCPPEGAQSNHADDTLCYSTGSIGSCSRKPSNLCSKDPSTSADARSRPMTQEKPSMALQKQLHSSQRQCARTALDHRESEGKETVGWQVSGLAVKQNIWLQRWSTMTSRKCEAVSRPNRGGRVLAGLTHAEKGSCISQGSRESSHRFDLRPAKRVCHEKRSGPHPGNGISQFGSFAVGREHIEKGVTSHFMKRFFTPSVAAMAIMGMTARKVHTTQPQRSGLFGVWASNASLRKPCGAQAEVCKEFLNCEKEISQSAATPSVDL